LNKDFSLGPAAYVVTASDMRAIEVRWQCHHQARWWHVSRRPRCQQSHLRRRITSHPILGVRYNNLLLNT